MVQVVHLLELEHLFVLFLFFVANLVQYFEQISPWLIEVLLDLLQVHFGLLAEKLKEHSLYFVLVHLQRLPRLLLGGHFQHCFREFPQVDFLLENLGSRLVFLLHVVNVVLAREFEYVSEEDVILVDFQGDETPPTPPENEALFVWVGLDFDFELPELVHLQQSLRLPDGA